MGGKQSRERTGQDQALFGMRSTSLESISTSASQRTLQSNGTTLPHSPSLDGMGHNHINNGRKFTTKDTKGNTYMLLDTASVTTTEIDAPSEKIDVKRGGGNLKAGEEKRCTAGEGEGTDPNSVLNNSDLNTRDVGGVSTKTATELASRRGSKHENSKLVQRVLPTRSQSTRVAVKPATAVVAPEQREMEREVQQLLKTMLKQQQQVPEPGGHTQATHSKSATTAVARDDTQSPSATAQLPKSLLQCSQQELNHLASYICHTIKDTLQSSLVEQALTAQQQKSAGEKTSEDLSSLPSVGRHMQSEEDVRKVRSTSTTTNKRNRSGVGYGERNGTRESVAAEGRIHRRRYKATRQERPVSTPGVYCEDDTCVNLSDPPVASSISPNSPSHEVQSQSHSNEENYYHRCGEGGSGGSSGTSNEVSPSTKTVTCRACREHSRRIRSKSSEEPLHRGEQRRKRGGRNKDVPVDVSLDDNCPGVNLIRRRYTHHRHVVCENCLQSLGKDSRTCRRPRQKQQQQTTLSSDVSATGGGGSGDLLLSSHDNRHDAVADAAGFGEGSGFITLYQLRTVAHILRESVACVDDDTIPETAKRLSIPQKSNSFRQDRRNHHQYRVKGKQKSVVFDDCLSTIARTTEFEGEAVGPVSPHPHLKELAYPAKSRSGRDSPATDMAVIDLSVNSPCMLQPLEPDTKETATTNLAITETAGSLNKITHLHHHYHHIIHHGEP